MDRLPAFVVMALFAAILQPPITEVGISGGPHWPDFADRETALRGAFRSNAAGRVSRFATITAFAKAARTKSPRLPRRDARIVRPP